MLRVKKTDGREITHKVNFVTVDGMGVGYTDPTNHMPMRITHDKIERVEFTFEPSDDLRRLSKEKQNALSDAHDPRKPRVNSSTGF